MSCGTEPPEERRFITDRMLGSLARYLRFMGYDTFSANSLTEGNRREDTVILDIARDSGRIILTRDRELARRGGEMAVLIESEDVLDGIRQLVSLGLITPVIRMDRCSICNTKLRPATSGEIEEADYAPATKDEAFFWCPGCKKLYWMGTHGRNLTRRIREATGDQ